MLKKLKDNLKSALSICTCHPALYGALGANHVAMHLHLAPSETLYLVAAGIYLALAVRG